MNSPPPQTDYTPAGPPPPSQKKSGLKYLAIAVGSTVFLCCCVAPAIGSLLPERPRPSGGTTPSVASATTAPAEPSRPAPPPTPPLEVSAVALVEAFEGNEVVAEDRYSGKTLRVTGRVERIRTDMTGDAIVELRTRNRFLSLGAELEDRGDAGRVTMGRSITLDCACGRAVMGRPHLDACRVVGP